MTLRTRLAFLTFLALGLSNPIGSAAHPPASGAQTLSVLFLGFFVGLAVWQVREWRRDINEPGP